MSVQKRLQHTHVKHITLEALNGASPREYINDATVTALREDTPVHFFIGAEHFVVDPYDIRSFVTDQNKK